MHTIVSTEYTCNSGCDFTPYCLGNSLSDEGTNTLPVKRRLVLQKNEVLFAPNKPFQHLYAVESGAIKTFQIEADGSELIRSFYFAGEILGYKAIYAGHFQSTGMALCETHICVIDYADFLYYLQSNPEVQQHILHLISLQMNVGSYLVNTSAERKLAAFLLDLSIRLHRSTTQHEFQLPMSRQDIGNYLRLTPETVSRICTRLQQQDVIALNHKNVRFVNPEQLKLIADGQSNV